MRGQELEVLVEGPSDESEYLLMGRHEGQAPEIDGQVYLSCRGRRATRRAGRGDAGARARDPLGGVRSGRDDRLKGSPTSGVLRVPILLAASPYAELDHPQHRAGRALADVGRDGDRRSAGSSRRVP